MYSMHRATTDRAGFPPPFGNEADCVCRLRSLCTCFVVFFAAALGANAPASAQTPEVFYKGKTIDFVIGYPPGGSNDTWGRILTRHLGKHIPGAPYVVPKNMPGAGSFLAVNTIFNVSPRDGTVIGIGAPTIPLDEKLATQGVRFRTAELNWIGRVDSLINIVFMWKTSPVKTFADAQKRESTLSGTGVGSTVSIYPTVMNDLSHRHEQRVRNEVQAGDGIQRLERSHARGRARRGRGPLDLLDRAQGGASGLDSRPQRVDPR